MFSRRDFLHNAMLGLSGMALSRYVSARPLSRQLVLYKNSNVLIPENASIRIVARSQQRVTAKSQYRWHSAPDGGACFATDDGGWIYVSNSEIDERGGGVGAIRFNVNGDIVDSYSLLQGTTRNCAGGKTPWGTWLSCEESGDTGQVYECDPEGIQPAKVRPYMGSFNHEAVAVDPRSSYCYMTEDVPDGCLYRYKPEQKGQLDRGVLEVAVADASVLAWKQVQDPLGKSVPVRYQVKEAARFRGGEGIVYHDRQVFFTTKKDNKVWRHHIDTGLLNTVYSAADYEQPLLTGVDNIEVSPSGELLIAEDGGNMQIIALDRQYQPYVLVQINGQDKSEITGPAFSPNGKRLYFSSQRGTTGRSEDGLTYELSFA